MNQSKNEEKKIDNFDYDTITEDSIANKDINEKEYKMNKVETARYNKFLEIHNKCLKDENGENKFGAIGGGISILFETTGIGDVVVCKCGGCNKKVNITDYDCW